LSPAEVATKAQVRPAALRFLPFVGVEEQDVETTVGDFVVRRNDGVASYQLAVVVDDAESGITHVLRGEDLLSSTPRQLQLYRALGATPPSYSHVPLVMGTDGKRLAKREGAFAVGELRQRGIPSQRVIGLLAMWSGLNPTGKPLGATDLISAFSASALAKGPITAREEDIRRQLGL
jgi:glutamyl-tRNA synthetase